MIKMKLLEVVTPPYIYHGRSTRKMLWEETFTGQEKITLGEFIVVNMKNYVCRNDRKHRDVKGSDKYITLEIFLKFGSMEKIRITSSEPKDNLGKSGKGLIASMGLKAKAIPKK